MRVFGALKGGRDSRCLYLSGEGSEVMIRSVSFSAVQPENLTIANCVVIGRNTMTMMWIFGFSPKYDRKQT